MTKIEMWLYVSIFGGFMKKLQTKLGKADTLSFFIILKGV